MRAQAGAPEGHCQATSGGRIDKGAMEIITRAAVARQLEPAAALRLTCWLLDSGFSDRDTAAIIGWHVDQVRRAAAERARAVGA